MIGVRAQERLAKIVVWAAGLVTVLLLVLIIGYILVQGMGRLSLSFLLENPCRMGAEGGILSPLVGTLYFTVLTILLAAPVGVGAAVFLTEFTRPGPLVRSIRFATDALAGIPSIVIGLFGFAFFVILLRPYTGGWSLLSGALTAFCMILPTIVRTSEEAISAVPDSYREGSLALGVSRWQTVVWVVLPGALPGILTGILLSVGRVVGETAPLLLTLGGSLLLPQTIFDPARTLSMHLYLVAMETGHFPAAFATGAVLVLLILVLNILSYALVRHLIRRAGGGTSGGIAGFFGLKAGDRFSKANLLYSRHRVSKT
ncbi:MAG: phosphate ABC transporter permease PstA [Bacillota bacterium]|jgi:phosphate transport system permease protein|nr:phosphate ABC transporter permease PstA [Bacillota bacterium]